jgi:hypothetical protein
VPKLRTYRVFISHCWEYAGDYDRLADWLDDEPLFRWKDLSVPAESPMREDKTLERRLRRRLEATDILLVIVGMEIAHRYWIKREIKWARIRSIPIVGVMPNAARRIPRVVETTGCPIIGWRRASVVGAIREWALVPR